MTNDHIVGDGDGSGCEGMGGDQEIVGAGEASGGLEGGPGFAIAAGRLDSSKIEEGYF